MENENLEEKTVYALGCVLLGAAFVCLIPFTRRRVASRVRPLLNRVGRAAPGEIAAVAGAAAAKSALAAGGKRFAGL